MLQRFFNNDLDWFGNNFFNTDRNRMNGVPPVNVTEKKDCYTVDMAAPGYQKSDFAVNVDKNVLTISVSKESKNESNEEKNSDKNKPYVYRREYNFSSFSRSFTLPEGVDGTKISGSYENGILSLRIPKDAKISTSKSIEIK